VNQKKRLLDHLQSKNLKVTRQREAILDLFLSRPEPWTLKSLFQKSRMQGVTHESTVYRVLTCFARAGILEKFTLPGRKQTSYSLQQPHLHSHHHHHIVCSSCGVVEHIEACLPKPFLNKVEKVSGFTVTDHALEFKGLCQKCG